jgi:hypothetical protein
MISLKDFYLNSGHDVIFRTRRTPLYTAANAKLPSRGVEFQGVTVIEDWDA